MAGAGRPVKEDMDGAAKPRHDDDAQAVPNSIHLLRSKP
jgi:hypothetical protein